MRPCMMAGSLWPLGALLVYARPVAVEHTQGVALCGSTGRACSDEPVARSSWPLVTVLGPEAWHARPAAVDDVRGGAATCP